MEIKYRKILGESRLYHLFEGFEVDDFIRLELVAGLTMTKMKYKLFDVHNVEGLKDSFKITVSLN